jgi:DNA anti-recombination protein RmuC
MTRENLATASELLASAANSTDDDAAERLTSLSEQLETLAERDRGPDHGRLARIESGLDEIQADASDEVAATIEDALDAIRAFRETIEGV